MADPIDSNATVSVEQNGIVLSGVGVSEDRLAETMERHAPPEPTPAAPAGPAATTAAESGAAVPEAPAAPLSRGRQRYADLTHERDEAKAAAEAAKAEREAAVRERDELKARFESARQPEREPAPPAEPAAPQYTRPKPTEEEIGLKYQSYADFVFDVAQWAYEQRMAEQTMTAEQQVRAILASERQREQFKGAVEASQDRGRKAYADFHTLLNGPAGAIPLANDRNEAIERVAFIANHPQSEHIQYAILKDVALAERLRDADPYTFGVTIAGLVPPAQAPKPAWTPPPPPYQPVGASSPTTAESFGEIAKKGHDYDKSGWRERWAAEHGKSRRR